MPVVNIVIPVLPGKEDVARSFARDVAGPRAAEFAEFQSAGGKTTRETWHLAGTPNGALLSVWIEAENPEAGFEHLATSTGFGEWFRAQILDFTGIDMSQPDGGPQTEQLLDWNA
jgi:hypothetical protein